MALPEVLCLAAVLWAEARGEGYTGKLLVADVVFNRVYDPRWPDTICDVTRQQFVSQKGQGTDWWLTVALADDLYRRRVLLPETGAVYFNTKGITNDYGHYLFSYGGHAFYSAP